MTQAHLTFGGSFAYRRCALKIDFVSAQVNPLAALGGPGFGSQHVHVAALARELGRRGHDVTVYTRRDAQNVPGRVRIGPGVTVEHVPAGPARELPHDKQLPCMAEFGAYLADRWLREPPDLVHAHYWMSGLAALAGAREMRLPVVQTFHGLGMPSSRRSAGEDPGPAARVRLEAAIARGVDAIVATSSDEAFGLVRLGVQRHLIRVIPSGVDTGQFTPDGPAPQRGGRPRLLTVGRLAPHTGLEEILQALAAVPDCELVIAGGPAKAKLRQDREYRRLAKMAGQLGVATRVKFCGRVSHREMPGMLRSADVVVSVPWHGPAGLVPLEAMACGTPVVASAVGGHQDTIIDGTTGVLVPPRQPDVLARRIRDLLASPMLCQGLGIAAADRAVARYSWERIGQETLAIYQQARRAQRSEPVAVPAAPGAAH
jgi:D-inositol-3-phosphate glycosyltransferase